MKTSFLSQSRHSMVQFWEQRDHRERRLLGFASVVILVAIIYVMLIDPALTGRSQLNENLPLLRQQVAQLQALSREATTFTGNSPQSIIPLSSDRVDSSLASHDLKPQSVILTGEFVKVKLGAASFASLLTWLEDMQKTTLLTVVEADIVSQTQPGQVDATLTLQQRSGK